MWLHLIDHLLIQNSDQWKSEQTERDGGQLIMTRICWLLFGKKFGFPKVDCKNGIVK